MSGLRNRSARPELMDDFNQGGEELREAHRHLRRLNRLFGASGPALYGVDKLWKEAGKPSVWTVMDVGAGSGDINRALLRWAERRGIELSIRLVDRTEEACAEARRLYRDEPRIEVLRADLFALRGIRADVVTASQVAHHYSDEELTGLVRALLRISRCGVVISDIHRSVVPWLAVFAATRLLSRNRYIRNDGPLSVAKGFRSSDWTRLSRSLGTGTLRYSWRPLYRYSVWIRE
ncbi:methyltransferase domain-containing protein [Cohnella thailandensis]|uniref:Methyltransferase domain-containing protein n=1 Tax=Cohnella thailandensis TaxID=557557 RepID=A0A841T223_9BACL|nr:methyltransferase domain-containing protein [Cohnella thailandensis]MBB6638204.1 methyltransferase domain-containing protein [Cohnella thailandensis]MBP1977762.1 2-polyprenyl-3-methyl-5-hydroxy-6-metoxy-1,4-benzoquinol methylase [Cohnella thailandensis]